MLIVAAWCAAAAGARAADDPARAFLGSWDLVAVESRYSDGTVEQPFGAQPVGRITYTADGHMSAHVMREGRAPFAAGGLYDGTDAEKAAAYTSYVAYYGDYSVDPAAGVVRHAIVGSLYPNWVGGVQERIYRFEGEDTLILSAKPFTAQGREVTPRITWRRVR